MTVLKWLKSKSEGCTYLQDFELKVVEDEPEKGVADEDDARIPGEQVVDRPWDSHPQHQALHYGFPYERDGYCAYSNHGPPRYNQQNVSRFK